MFSVFIFALKLLLASLCHKSSAPLSVFSQTLADLAGVVDLCRKCKIYEKFLSVRITTPKVYLLTW